MRHNLPVMILAGGLGTRLREETEFRPKPMVPIGGKPILWHIMKLYAHFGFYRFIICLGYKGEMIKNYFLNYRLDSSDFTVNTRTGALTAHRSIEDEWEVTLVDTGDECMTGGRIARAASYVDTDRFLATYGDGVANINIDKLLEFHTEHKKLATLTSVPLPSRFGNLAYTPEQQITAFMEKDQINNELINGGFFVFERAALKYLAPDDSCILEQGPLQKMALDQQLMMYKHEGFWQCMDTLREKQKLEELWLTDAPWKMWEKSQTFDPAIVDNKAFSEQKQG